MRFALPEATYLAWLDVSAYGLGDDPAKVLLDDARVALSSGNDFGEHGAGFVRLNFATTRADSRRGPRPYRGAATRLALAA